MLVVAGVVVKETSQLRGEKFRVKPVEHASASGNQALFGLGERFRLCDCSLLQMTASSELISLFSL